MIGLEMPLVVTLAITVAALALFLWNRLPVEVVGVLVMVALVVSAVVTPRDGVSGFANEATVTVALMLVLSVGLVRTGAVDTIGLWMGRIGGGREWRLLAVVVVLATFVSAFLNNTAVVAIMVPAILGLSRSSGIAPSRILMPLSFAGQMGGTLTLVGTSTNLLVAGLVLDLGVARIGLFDITLPALALSAIGIVYLLTVGRLLTARRDPPDDLLKQYELREYMTALTVEPGSRLSGQSLAETNFGESYGLTVVRVERSTGAIRYPSGSTVLRSNDILLVRGGIPDIAQIEELEGIRIADMPHPMPPSSAPGVGEEVGSDLAEVIVPPRSQLIGHTLAEIGFRARFGLNALGLQRHGRAIHERIGGVTLHAGDILLVQGPAEAIRALHDGRDLALLGPIQLPAKRRRKRRLAVAIMAGVVLLPAFGATTILVSALAGVAAMLLTRCVTPEEVYEEMDWSVVILLATLIPLGIAMQNTGAAELVASGILRWTGGLGSQGTLAAFYVVTVALTAVISNAAAAVVLTPIAVATAQSLGVSPLPFIVAVMFAASNSYITPIGYQTNLFVYGPGGYRFGDFARLGGPLTLLNIVAATYLIPLFFPFDAS